VIAQPSQLPIPKEVDMDEERRIAELEDQIEQLKARLPAHSVPAAMIIELEDLEDELEALRARMKRGADER
jgi:HAMP domain-containing protein